MSAPRRQTHVAAPVRTDLVTTERDPHRYIVLGYILSTILAALALAGVAWLVVAIALHLSGGAS